jgi:hypothetical protein
MLFDESSCEWRKNKIYLGKGIFRYKCTVANCNNILYVYTTENKHFDTFASSFDYLNKNNPRKYLYCEEHLLEENK